MENKFEEAKARRGKLAYLVLGGVLALVVLVVGGYLLVTAGTEETDDAQVTADMVPIGSRVAGQVVKVQVTENQLVKKGDPIAQIDQADFAAKLRQAEAELESARAQAAAADAQASVVEATSRGGLASAEAVYSGSSVGVSSAAAQVAAAQAAVVRAQADLRKSDSDLARAHELRKANAVPEERLDNAKAAHDSAEAALAQAQALLAAAQEQKHGAEARVSEARGRLAQSTPIDAQIAAARAGAELGKARVKGAEATLELARLQLSYTTIVAPSDGFASKLSVHEGQLINVGQPLVELVPTAVYVIANFKETQIGKMRPGQPARISVDALPHQTLEGKVESISGGTGSSFSLLPADNASGNFVKVVQRVPVRIALSTLPSEVVLRAGLSADVSVEVGR